MISNHKSTEMVYGQWEGASGRNGGCRARNTITRAERWKMEIQGDRRGREIREIKRDSGREPACKQLCSQIVYCTCVTGQATDQQPHTSKTHASNSQNHGGVPAFVKN